MTLLKTLSEDFVLLILAPLFEGTKSLYLNLKTVLVAISYQV